MVVFVCSVCGTSLKKSQVDKHWNTRCGHTMRLSCMDCCKEFYGQEYAAHIKCITENEKYGGSGYKVKEMKGEKKQEAWIAQINEKIANTHNMEPNLRNLLQTITNYSNIPRKKTKFMNFIANSVHCRSPALVDKAWEVFQAANTTKPSNGNKTQVNGTSENTQTKPTEVDNDDKVPNGNTEEQKEEPVPKLNKKERKEERQKKQAKKTKKQKRIEKMEASVPVKRKLDEDDSEPTKNKKKRKHEDEQLMDTEVTGVKSKKKKRKHENGDHVAEEQVELGGKAKKKDLNCSLVANDNHNLTLSNDSDLTGADSKGSFKWKVAIKTVLDQGPAEGMKLSKLQRKVLALYVASDKAAASGHQKTKEELIAILNKKLHLKNDKYLVCNDRVKLRV